MLKLREGSLDFKERQGDIQRYPIMIVGLLFAHFSLLGFPLLASFPPIFAIWEGVARQNDLAAIWVGVGIASLFTGAIRTLAVVVMSSEEEGWSMESGWSAIILIGTGMFILLMLGFFPQLLQPILSALPEAFSHIVG